MELLLITSQEHEKLPYAEITAVLEAEEIEADMDILREGLVILRNLNEDSFKHSYKRLTSRLAYTHEVCHLLKETSLDNLNEDFITINWGEIIDETFVVRVKHFNSDIDSTKVERTLGQLVVDNWDFKVNLTKAKTIIRIISFKNQIFITNEFYRLNKKHFQELKPHKRPFFHPGSMSPKLARCMVNLSRAKEGDLLLDPFCGTGGILIEGGMVGTRLVGCDINWKMKNGSRINLDYMGIKNYKTHQVDITELKMYEKVDVVVTDPPYGISTTTGGRDDLIFKDFLISIYNNMKENAVLVMASPHYLDLDVFLDEVGFKLLERYEIKMHRSLTRIISIISKIN